MAGFILFNNSIEYDNVITYYKSQKKICFEINDLINYKLLIYNNELRDYNNYNSDEGNQIFVIGTLIYKGLSIAESLRTLLLDFERNEFDINETLGVFFILINKDNKLYFLNDCSGLFSIYHSVDGSILSSSFIDLIKITPLALTYCYTSLYELLLTGSLIGPETIVSEIRRFERKLPCHFIGLQFIDLLPDIQREKTGNYVNSVSYQIDQLDKYFESIKRLAEEVGVISGITGGLDSRIILAMCLKHLNNFMLFTHNRRDFDPEFKIAVELCQKAKLDLISPPIKHPLDMSEQEMIFQLKKSLMYMDGQIRVNAFWTEEYNTSEYIKNLSSSYGLMLNGIGGEQYRNQERIWYRKVNFKLWLFYEMTFRHIGNPFLSRRIKSEYLKHIVNKSNRLLGLSSYKHVSHLVIKRYLNEVYIPACRGVKTVLENQIAYSLAPFAEYKISQNAYIIIPWLGLSKRFEIKMLNILNNKLADINTNYRFKPSEGEPFKSRILTIIKEFLPMSWYYVLLYNRQSKNFFYDDFAEKYSFAARLEKNVSDLNLKIDLNRIKNSSALSPILIALGFFIENFKEKIKVNDPIN